MFKKFWKAAKSPLWKMVKFINGTSVIFALFALVFGGFNIITSIAPSGPATLGDLVESTILTYFRTFQIGMFALSPLVLFYSGIKMFFQMIFPKEESQKNDKKQENVVEAKFEEVKTHEKHYPVTAISKRKAEIQQTIMTLLEENQNSLDLEEIHTLERINEELLTKTEESYYSLTSEDQKKYEEEVLKRFDELEEMAHEAIRKVNREHENQLKKQLHIIDEVTK